MGDADAKAKFLAAEALRGVGGVLIDREGKRFCNELGRRDYVSGMMWKNQPPFGLCLNSKASKEIHWHCEHYKGRGVMKGYKNMQALCDETGIKPDVLKKTLDDHTDIGKKQEANENGGTYDAYPSGKSYDPWGKKFFHNLPTTFDDAYSIAIVTPTIHYCMGGRDRGRCARQQPPRRQLAARLRGLRPRDGPLLRGVDVRQERRVPLVPEGGVDCFSGHARTLERMALAIVQKDLRACADDFTGQTASAVCR